MSRMPMGKMLLRNVIRHTDAHNKIQEESEMWKLRDMERQAQEHTCDRKMEAAHLIRDGMHCDRTDRGRETSRESFGEREAKEARYWSRKLYEFEASDPERWGHSGFKELYPEEFQSDSAKEGSDGENMQKNRLDKADLESDRHKRSKKKKKKKKKERRRRRKGDSSEGEGSSSDAGAKQSKRTRGKAKHRRKRKEREHRGNCGSQDRGAEVRKRVCPEPEAAEQGPQRKRRNWKEAEEERSEESCED